MIANICAARLHSRFPDEESTGNPGHATLGGMQPLTSQIVIDAPADHVWAIVAHRFDRIGDWATAISSSAAVHTSVLPDVPVAGRVCRTGIRAVPQVTETIVAYDEVAKTLTYEATAGLPSFVTLARNTWQVSALSEQRCTVTYAGQLQVRGLLGWLAKRLLLARVSSDGRYLLDDLKHYAEHGEASPRKLGDPVAALGTRSTSRLLRAALRANTVFSLGSGLALVAGGWWYLPLLVVGVPVAAFGLLVAGIAVAPADRLRGKAIAVIVADIGWVAASAILLAFMPVPFAAGMAIGGVGAVVAVLAGWQIAGLAVMRSDDPLADMEVIEASRWFPTAPPRMWPLLTDHRLYGRLAPNLSKVEVISQPGEMLRRRCTSTGGQHWQETCTLWQEGRRFAVEVDTSSYPYPMRVMHGLWQVDPHLDGCTVTMRFVFQAKTTIRGGLFVIGLRLLFTRALAQIFDGWQCETLQPGLTESTGTASA